MGAHCIESDSVQVSEEIRRAGGCLSPMAVHFNGLIPYSPDPHYVVSESLPYFTSTVASMLLHFL